MQTHSNEHRGLGRVSLTLAALLFCVPSLAQARTETLRWMHDQPAEVVGFKVSWGSESRWVNSYANTLDVGKPAADAEGIFQYDLTVPDDATVYVAVAAYDSAGVDSFYSNENQLLPAGGTPTEPPTDPGGTTGSALPPFSDTFGSGLTQWEENLNAWSTVGGELQTTTAQFERNLLAFTAGQLETANQCQTMKLVANGGDMDPGFVFRASSTDLNLADRYDVQVNPVGDWKWIPHSGGSWVGGVEGQMPFNTTGKCNSFPCYVSACIAGSGLDKELRVYEHGASKPPEDPSQWSGDLAGTMFDDPGVTDIPDTGTVVGLRVYSRTSSQLLRIDDWWANDYTPGTGGGTGGTDPGGTDPGGTDPGGTDPGGTDPGGTDPGGTDPNNTLGQPGQPVLVP